MMNRNDIDNEIEKLQSRVSDHDKRLDRADGNIKALYEAKALENQVRSYLLRKEQREESASGTFAIGAVIGIGLTVATGFVISALSAPNLDVQKQTPETGFSGFGALSF